MRRKVKKRPIFLFCIIIIILVTGIIFFNKSKTKTTNKKVNTKKEIKKIDTVKKEEEHDDIKLRDGEVLIGKSSKGYNITKYNDVYYVDGVLIANKSYPLPSNFKTINSYKEITKDYLSGADYIDKDVMNAYLKMQEDALNEGLKIYIISGYRSYSVQNELYNNYVKRDGKTEADTYSARPGYSEHQTGLCFDLNSVESTFINTEEGKWLNDNAYKYGFILRYPENATDKTGYIFEGWHYRYVGNELSIKLYNNGNWISLEEYYGIESHYED